MARPVGNASFYVSRAHTRNRWLVAQVIIAASSLLFLFIRLQQTFREIITFSYSSVLNNFKRKRNEMIPAASLQPNERVYHQSRLEDATCACSYESYYFLLLLCCPLVGKLGARIFIPKTVMMMMKIIFDDCRSFLNSSFYSFLLFFSVKQQHQTTLACSDTLIAVFVEPLVPKCFLLLLLLQPHHLPIVGLLLFLWISLRVCVDAEP